MTINLNDTTPAAAAGGVNVKWQVDGSNNVSAYLPIGGIPQPVVNEIVAFTGTAGTLANTPNATIGYSDVKLFKNGERFTPGMGNDFTISGAAITLAVAALMTDEFLADYYK